MLAEKKHAGEQPPSSPSAADGTIPKARDAKDSTSGADRRRDLRYPSHVPVEIRIFPSDGSRITATLIDISLSGLQLELDATLPKGVQIEILLSKQLAVFGEVRHCRRVRAKYRAGILISQAFYASQPEGHISDELIKKYLTANGLPIAEVLRVREHLTLCNGCCRRVVAALSKKLQSRPS